MPSIYVFKRKRKGKADKIYSAQIRFSGKTAANFLRSTGKTNEREALAEARRITDEIARKELPNRGREIMTLDLMFGKWFDEYGYKLRSQKDIAWQVKRILAGIGSETLIEEISNKTVHRFAISENEGGASPVVINRCLTLLRAVMRYAGRKWEEPVKMIDWGAHFQAEPKEREIYLSPDEARRLMEILPPHIALAFAWPVYTGCRLNETETLVWERVDLTRRLAIVETKADGEEIVRRNAWLSEKAIRILMAIGPGTGTVFDLTNRRKHWERARAQIGRPDVHWHDLRAMTATWSRQFAGKDLKLIGRALGHADESTTARYAHVVDTEVVEMLDQLPDIGTPKRAPERKRLSFLLSKDKSRSDRGDKTG